MKYSKLFIVLFFSSLMSLYNCNDTTKTSNQDTVKPETSSLPTTTKAVTKKAATVKTETAQNTGKIWHYTCSKGCTGGAAVAGNCATCGTTLAHNAAYHNKPNNTPTSSAPFATTPPPTQVTAKTPEPSQNKSGIWHYTCSKGCAGGAGSAIACTTCNTTLAHNAAYHQ